MLLLRNILSHYKLANNLINVRLSTFITASVKKYFSSLLQLYVQTFAFHKEHSIYLIKY